MYSKMSAMAFRQTVLFTDVVSSTEQLARMGDRAWSSLVGRLERGSRAAVQAHAGRVVKFTGDGVLAVFDEPTSAVGCAPVLRRQAEDLGLVVRCGLATGPVEERAGDVFGMTVVLAQRVQACAAAGQILATAETIAGIGSLIPSCRPAGNRHLKGVVGEAPVVEIEPPAVGSTRAATAVIIDDHPGFRRSVRALVESEGIAVVATAPDGASGLSLAASHHPDLVLVDVQLPSLDGFDVAARLAALPHPPVVVLISARDRSAYGERVTNAAFVTKAELGHTSFADLLAAGRAS
jgi:CheY-like chemotaxis protein